MTVIALDTCPCSHPANELTDPPRYRPSEMQLGGPEGCRRCKGSGRSRHCAPCWGTGAVTRSGDVATCSSCAGAGRQAVAA